jgi:hypothetical protein
MLGATAAGTVLLAAFTDALAFTTSGDVSARWQLAQLTIADQAARELRILLTTRKQLVERGATYYQGNRQFSQFTLVMLVRNVGLRTRHEALIRVIGPGDAAIGDTFTWRRDTTAGAGSRVCIVESDAPRTRSLGGVVVAGLAAGCMGSGSHGPLTAGQADPHRPSGSGEVASGFGRIPGRRWQRPER